MKAKSKKRSPAGKERLRKWAMSRRYFLKGVMLSLAASQMPLWSSCSNRKSSKWKPYLNKLTRDQILILRRVQDILFPDDGNGPGAADINADSYLQWVIRDPRMDKDEVEYIIDGIGWVNETAQEDHGEDFPDLKKKEQAQVIEKISKESWGEDWLAVILSYIFEALLADPLYGGNPEGTGWKWLDVYPGYPRPDASLLYDEIFRTVHS